MILIDFSENKYDKKIIENIKIENIDFINFNFNKVSDELKLFVDEMKITDNKIEIYKGGLLVSSIDVSDITITKLLSHNPTNKEVNGLNLIQTKLEHIISFKQFNTLNKIHKLKHIYISQRNTIDYIYIKK